MKKQLWRITPKTTSGWWSVGLFVAMPILIFTGFSFTNTLYPSVLAGESLLADVIARPALALTMLAGFAAGISAFITGLLAILWQNEKSALVYISTAAGALLIFYLAGEFMFPH
jgi:hypothetical protein